MWWDFSKTLNRFLKNGDNPVSRVSILGFMTPIMGVLLSALFLGEGSEAFSWTGLKAAI